MLRRAALLTGGVVAGLVLLVVLAVAAILASGPGHAVARRLAVAALARSVDGRVRIGSVGGPLWRAVDLHHVELETPDGRPVIRADRVTLHYDPATLARGRYVFSRVEVVRPMVLLEPAADGRLTLEHLFRLVQPTAPGPPATAHPGRRPVVELHGVRVTHGTVILRERAARGAPRPPRRFDDINLDLGMLRASNPDSAGIMAVVRRLEVAVSDPAARVRDARGTVVIEGDSLRFDLSRLELRGTAGSVRGTVRWGDGLARRRPTLDLAASLGRASVGDFRWAIPGLPSGGTGRVNVRARLWPDGASEWRFAGADLAAGHSRVRGSAALTVAADGAVTIQRLALDLQPLELARLVPFLGTLPVSGLATGQLTASGTPASLTVGADLAFLDGRIPSHPVSHLVGSGAVSVGGAAGFVFHHFALTQSDVALATIERLAPSVTLRGRLRLVGDLDGPWADATFGGVVRHQEGAGPVSTLRGMVRLTLADTVRVDADVVADSLSLDDLARSYPALGGTGMLAGPVRVSGPVTRLAIAASLTGRGGGVTASGEVAVGDSTVRLRGAGTLDSLDLQVRLAGGGAPVTRLNGSWRADVTLPDSTGRSPTIGTVAVALQRSEVAHLSLRRAELRTHVTAGRLVVDTAYAEQPGLNVAMAGALGRPGARAGQLRFVVRADTLANLAPLVAWAERVTGDTTTAGRVDLRGAGRVSGRVEGTLGDWTARGNLVVDSLTIGTFSALAARGSGMIARDAGGYRLDVQATMDSLAAAGMRYGGVSVGAAGALDSMVFHVGGAFGLGSAVAVAVGLQTDPAGWSARLLRARVVLRDRPWVLTGQPRITADARGLAFDPVVLAGPEGGQVRLWGRLPGAAAGDFAIVADSVPLPDLYALAQRDTTGVGGVLGGRVHLTGTAAAPRFNARAAVADARFGEFRAPRLDAAADYADQRLVFHAGLGQPGEPVVTASGSLPLDLALASVARRQLPGPIGIQVRVDSADLSIVDVLTPLARDASGRLTAAVTVRGSWEQPELGGSIRLSGGAARIPVLGARYSDIEANVALDGDSLRFLEGRLRGGAGTLDIGGSVRFASLSRPVLHLTAHARSFAAFSQRDFAGLTASGDVTLTGPLLGATLSGRAVVDAGYLAFTDLVEKRIVNLDDPEFRAVVDSNLAQAADLGPTASNVFLDSLRIRSLTVTMGPDVWLRSHEANIQLAGSFTVAKGVVGGASQYRLDGTLRATRGTYRLVVGPTAKEFRVTRGTVRFFGTPDFDPVLDIAAEHTVRAVSGSDIVVRVIIGGTLLVPKLTLESDQQPPLSESEIVSYLLFGRPSFDLTSGGTAVTSSEQAILQGAMAGLAGAVSGELEQSLVTNLGLPLDYLAIRPGGGSVGGIFGAARVEAGTQLGERTFLSLNAGLCEVTRGLSTQALGASIEHRLGSSWTVEASIEPTLQECRPAAFQIRPPTPYQIGFDLFWQWGTP